MSAPADPEKSKSITKAALVSTSSALGWGFELFDFTSFMFAATYFAPLFFPSSDPNTSILYAFVTSAIAFISRPIGGFVFGHYGDRLGRKSVWFTALLGMGLVSFALGCLPTYQQVGILATLLMVILRGFQGFFLAGEMAGGWTLTAEVSPAKWRAFFSGIVATGSTMSGLFLSMAIFLANYFAPGAQLGIWGWRVIFWAGLLPLAIALVVRWQAAESVEWKLKAKPKVEKLPLITAMRTDLKFFLVIFVCFAGQAVFMYSGVTFMASFMRLYPKFPADQIATIVLITNIFSLIAAPIWGLVSDVRKTRKWFIATGFLISAAILYPVVYTINLGQFWPAVVASVINCLFVPLAISALPVWIAENTHSTVRYSMTAVGSGFGAALGGIAPILVVQYAPTIGPVNAVSAVGITGCLIAVIAVIFSPKDRAKQELE